jgi:hypothetical protein
MTINVAGPQSQSQSQRAKAAAIEEHWTGTGTGTLNIRRILNLVVTSLRSTPRGGGAIGESSGKEDAVLRSRCRRPSAAVRATPNMRRGAVPQASRQACPCPSAHFFLSRDAQSSPAQPCPAPGLPSSADDPAAKEKRP